jgi:hypothetical protein
VPEKKLQFGPTRVRAPIVMGEVSMNVQSLLMKTPFRSLADEVSLKDSSTESQVL